MAHIKDSQSYHFSAQPRRRDHSMLWAILIAVALHVLLIFGISFTTGQHPTDMVKEVATALTQNLQPNQDAHFIANASQQGSGSIEEALRMETAQSSPLSADSVQQTQDIINQQRQVRQQQYQESYLRTTLSWRHADSEQDNDSQQQQDDMQAQEELVRRQIATLEAQLSQQQQVLAAKTQIQTVDSNATTHGKASQYLEKFRQHVERIANQYYPVQALAQNITGDVRLMVIITSDGQVKAIRLLESSGSTILDEAAKQSVRQSAPYGKFTADMKDIVELRVIRTWRYSDSIRVTY